MKRLLLLAGLIFAGTAFAGTPITNINKPIVVKRTERTVTIRLKSNRTTGYGWYLTRYPDELIEPVTYKYIPSKSDLVGAGGVSEWTFRVDDDAFDVPMVFRIAMRYMRPFEKPEGKPTLITFVTQR